MVNTQIRQEKQTERLYTTLRKAISKFDLPNENSGYLVVCDGKPQLKSENDSLPAEGVF